MSDAIDPLTPKYKRVLLKMSGEAFGHGGQSGISLTETMGIAEQIKRVVSRGVQLAVVVGGGNVLRGAPVAARRGGKRGARRGGPVHGGGE